jgi:hypothetical protein
MDKNRLKIKEQVEADIKKEQQPVKSDEQEEGGENVKEAKKEPQPQKLRKFPQFMIYFHVYDIATRKAIVEFEDYSESKIKSKAVKEELTGHRTRLLSSKYEKDVLTPLTTIYDGYNWFFYVTKNNWVIFRKLKSILP